METKTSCVIDINNNNSHNGINASGETFKPVTNPSRLLPILEKRLPESCFIINQLKSYQKFTEEMHVSSYDTEDPMDTWIVIKFHREDYELMVSISAPSTPILEKMKGIFLTSGLIEWDKSIILTALQLPVYEMIMSLQMEIGNVTTVYPCYLFLMNADKALELDLSCDPIVELKPLDPETGTKFITENWKYSNDRTPIFVRKSIERLVSRGVYATNASREEELVCGTITPGIGLISMLHTDPQHRRQGYASLCMKAMFKQLAAEGFHPCLVAELWNKSAVKFHHSCGLDCVAKVYYVSSNLDI